MNKKYRNTKTELRYPVKLNALEWYYVLGRYVEVFHQIAEESRPIHIKIPTVTLRRLLKIKNGLTKNL